MRLLVVALAIVIAGCAEPAPADDVAVEPMEESVIDAEVEPGMKWVIEDVEYMFEGSLGNQAFACAVVVCYGTGLGEWNNADDVTSIVAAELTMSWDGPQELAFGVASSCDGSCDFETYEVGASPLSVSVDGLDPDATYTVVAWHPYKGAFVAGAQAGPATDLVIDGVTSQAKQVPA